MRLFAASVQFILHIPSRVRLKSSVLAQHVDGEDCLELLAGWAFHVAEQGRGQVQLQRFGRREGRHVDHR